MTASIVNLMMIDDERIDQMLHRRIVERSGLVEEIHQFTDARDALEHLIGGARPDAILLDVRMPSMDGFAFLEAATAALGGQLSGIVVLMLTTSLDPGDQERAASFDVVKDYLYKPLIEEHLERIAELVSSTT